MGHRLDFLVIGAQKCATSWLYYCLKEHPMIHLPAKKREENYLGGDLYNRCGADWYFSLLNGAADHQKVGAVSVDYLFDARSAEVVFRYAPRIKLIVSLRNPIKRAISAYFWYIRKNMLPDLPLEEGLEIAMGKDMPNENASFGNRYAEVLTRGFYDAQVERYLQYFDPEQILFVLYEDIQRAPEKTLGQVYDAIGVDRFRPSSLHKRPKVNSNFRFFILMERWLPSSRYVSKLFDLSNHLLLRIGASGPEPGLSDSLMHRLRHMYSPHVFNLARIISRSPVRNRPFSEIPETWGFSDLHRGRQGPKER